MTGRAEPPPESEAAQTLRLLVSIWNRRWIVLGFLVTGIALAFAASYLMTPKYRANLTFEVQRQPTQIMESGSLDPEVVADAEHITTQIQLLKSRTLASQTIDQLGLSDNESFADPEEPAETRQAQATDHLVENLSISPYARSRVITASYVSEDPETAASVLNELARAFIENTLERRFDASAYAREFLDERIATTKSQLETSERALAQYAQENGILELSSASGAQVSSLDEASLQTLNFALADAEKTRISAEQRYREASATNSTSEIVSSETMKELEVRRAALAAELQELMARYDSRHPSVRDVQSQLVSVEISLAEASRRIIDSLEVEYRAALAAEQRLRARVGELTNQVQDLRSRSIDYQILQREVDTNRAQYDALLQRYKDISVAGAVGESQLTVVDWAVPPREPFAPNYLRNVLIAAIVFLGAGVALALALEFIDDRIKSSKDVWAKLGEPVIGVVPRISGKFNFNKEIGKQDSQFAEAYQSVRSSLSFSRQQGAPRSILVASTRPKEGKSVTVSALGISFARTGHRVLIIDADIRKPSRTADAHSIGLSGLLKNPNERLEDHVVHGVIEGFHLLPAGRVSGGAAETLASRRLEQIIQEAETSYDVVLIDSAPALAYSDAARLGSICEACIMVVQSRGVRTPFIQRTIAGLRYANAPIVGVLLTQVNMKRDLDVYGYGYGPNKASPTGVNFTSEASVERKPNLFGVES